MLDNEVVVVSKDRVQGKDCQDPAGCACGSDAQKGKNSQANVGYSACAVLARNRQHLCVRERRKMGGQGLGCCEGAAWGQREGCLGRFRVCVCVCDRADLIQGV